MALFACNLGGGAAKNTCVVDQDCDPGRYCNRGLCGADRPSPARFTLAAAVGGSVDFGEVLLGESADQMFVLANQGKDPGDGAITLAAAPEAGFTILSDDAGDCPAGMATFDGGSSCNVRVRFTPSVPGAGTAVVSLDGAAMDGAPAPLELRGNGQRRGALSGTTNHGFGSGETGQVTGAVSWTITNLGDVETGLPSLDASGASELVVMSNGCTTKIGGGDSCVITVGFRPAAAGPRSGKLTLSASPGGSVTFTASATGQYRVTVSTAGNGSGTVTSTPVGLSCGTTCSFLTDAATVTLQARTTNGSNSFFSGWSGGGCAGPGRDCAVSVEGPVTATATFSPMANNLVFMTSATFPTNRGGAALYDADCNNAATAAGINDASGTAYVAMMSDTTSTAASRLGGARGWIRMDGRPFADMVRDDSMSTTVINTVRFDELGRDAGNAIAMTGMAATGRVADNCSDWTAPVASQALFGGLSEGGPFSWLSGVWSILCGGSYRLVCLGKTKDSPVSPVTTPGRLIWMSSNTYTIGGTQSPDQFCQFDKPAGVTIAAALVAYTNKPAAAVLDMTTTYVRPDGTLVGTGARIATGGTLESGIWLTKDGIATQIGYFGDLMWTGQTNLTSPGTVASTCGNWTNITQQAGVQGSNKVASSQWWNTGTALCNNAIGGMGGLYCVQVAP